MANLKQLKDRISSVKSTKKITQAMKVVAASKLKKSRKSLESNKEYIEQMSVLMHDVFANIADHDLFPLVFPKDSVRNDQTLVLVFGSDKGLCGAFNSSLVRYLKAHLSSVSGSKKKILCIGKKVYDGLKHDLSISVELFRDDNNLSVDDVRELTQSLVQQFYSGEFSSCVVFYNQFISSMTQKNTHKSLIPLFSKEMKDEYKTNEKDSSQEQVVFENDPNIEAMAVGLAELYIDANLFSILLETASGEHGARMTAMDNAHRNAGEMIKKITTLYNRTRQSAVTNELIEIISGMEAIRKN